MGVSCTAFVLTGTVDVLNCFVMCGVCVCGCVYMWVCVCVDGCVCGCVYVWMGVYVGVCVDVVLSGFV